MKLMILLGLLFLPFLSGCGGGSGGATGGNPVTSAIRTVDALDISITLPKTAFTQG